MCIRDSIYCVIFFQAEDGIRDPLWSRGLGDVYKRQVYMGSKSRRKSTTSKKCKSNFPVGELSKQRATSGVPFEIKGICTLKKRLQRLKNKVSLA